MVSLWSMILSYRHYPLIVSAVSFFNIYTSLSIIRLVIIDISKFFPRFLIEVQAGWSDQFRKPISEEHLLQKRNTWAKVFQIKILLGKTHQPERVAAWVFFRRSLPPPPTAKASFSVDFIEVSACRGCPLTGKQLRDSITSITARHPNSRDLSPSWMILIRFVIARVFRKQIRGDDANFF